MAKHCNACDTRHHDSEECPPKLETAKLKVELEKILWNLTENASLVDAHNDNIEIVRKLIKGIE